MRHTRPQARAGVFGYVRSGHIAGMKQDDILSRWIADLLDRDLMEAFDESLAKDQVSLMWRLADEIEKRKISI